MKYIKLGGRRGGMAIVDDEDYNRLVQYHWSMGKHGYVQRHHTTPEKPSTIMLMHHDVMGKQRLDHKDGNKLNNTRDNLRPCTQRQNSFNRSSSKSNTSGYKCVTLHNQTGKWKAYIKVNYKQIALGCYDTPEKAAAVYNYAAIDQYGEFARLNTLPDGVSFTREYLASERAAYSNLQKTPEYREATRQKVTQRWAKRKAEGHSRL